MHQAAYWSTPTVRSTSQSGPTTSPSDTTGSHTLSDVGVNSSKSQTTLVPHPKLPAAQHLSHHRFLRSYMSRSIQPPMSIALYRCTSLYVCAHQLACTRFSPASNAATMASRL